MFYPVVIPFWIKWCYPSCIWNISDPGNRIFLTFDDGPIIGPTEFVLDTLQQYEAKANFFCIGNNVQQNPELYHRILKEGHLAGNHTYNHLNAWQVSTRSYLKDIEDADALIHSPYFRPPYGRCWPWQMALLKKKGKIPVMWSILSGDFDKKISQEQCAANVLENMRPGSIVVFHDSLKADDKIKFVLPLVLEKIRENGWKTERLDYKEFKKIGPG